MPTKAKAASIFNNDVKPNTRALTSVFIKEPLISQVIAVIN
jgi:hypothetical protein